MPELPKEYKHLWKPFRTKGVLFHLTTTQNFELIKELGRIEPRDPAPKHWDGMKAVFMADPNDDLYQQTLPDVLAHVQEKHQHLVRLHIKTNNQLYKSTDPYRTFQVASLEPISIKDIVEIEKVG